MLVKSKNKSGTRSICICKNCGQVFSELNIKIRKGSGKFCSQQCYQEFRKKNAKDKKELNRFNQKKHKYGLSKIEYLNLHIQQNNKCAICQTDITNKSCVDHNHKNGKIRGLLCHRCNLILGMANENVDIFKKCIKYLENNKD